MKIVAILLVLAAAVVYFVTSDTEWSNYKVNHNKVYETLEEEQFRKKIFEKNKKMVEEHNKKFEEGLVSFTIGINQFSDMTDEETRQLVSCYTTKKSSMRSSSVPRTQYVKLQNITIPDAMDWRDKGAVTRVRYEGMCNSCWAFSATGAIEGQIHINTGKLVELSEQNLIDCSIENDGCITGNMDFSFKYIISNGGIDTEDSYPYEGKLGKCRYKTDSIGAKISDFEDIDEGDEEALRQAVALKGPISVAVSSNNNQFWFYTEGVFNRPNCNDADATTDHAMLVVGYGTDPSGADYWIVKNSWGEEWGMKGYILMSRNKNNQCFIASEASYPIL